MSSAETLAVLNNLSKRKVSRRERKSRSKQFASTCVRRSGKSNTNDSSKSRVTIEEEPRAKKQKSNAEITRERNIVALHAADKLISKKCKDLQKDVIELLRAQKEQRKPKIRKPKLTYFDFEDSD
ncbi:hypothetical protein IW140_002620 [Coemansia sp. RSA 1813]|nr:hypothetical protein EV178_002052 [Coemansia sp. RSA 1646]KAJ1772681.1 hypothetical protein LPJ74_001207 [Coemansia sp. RSA 1843]KAJ2090632.1 hypothetical protein IW138_002446 [Coemansia sp. RSA 986]KAJ2216163.1 hypothetical protein EV179_001623 [Coemansia sp. RSA 487]KAJ2570150.1 hypothetical protein IW140_002620 [Coemansia sp. RSA 1813]